MSLPVTRLRRWFALGAMVMIATVAGMYFYAQWRLGKAFHHAPARIGLDIQQTAEGFSISKSAEGRTLFTVSASKAVQFKGGGRAELHNVKIVVYGKDAGRFDRITGEDFEYDPASGNVSAKGTVLIDLEANPEGAAGSDQAVPEQPRNPIHIETNGLVFNRNTGDASASGKVVFATPQAEGSAVGIRYVARAGTMDLVSAVEVTVNQPQRVQLKAEHGQISKQPRQVELTRVSLARENQQLRTERATFVLREDNTVDRVLAEGGVESEMRGRSEAKARADRAELLLSGPKNQLTTAVFSGNVQMAGDGPEPLNAGAGKVTLRFGGQQALKTVRAEEGVRLAQRKAQATKGDQDVEMTAPSMNFVVKDGRVLELAETEGPPQIAITQTAENQKTLVTAARFTAKFNDRNRLVALHGEPDARIVSGKISGGPSERVSTSHSLDVSFLPQGGIGLITQAGNLVYTDGAQKATAQRGDYTAADQMLVLSGSPRVVDGGMTTTAQTIRMNRQTGDATAEGNVKSTYSDLKPQADGALLGASDPIHVAARTMTAHRSPAVAVYGGGARLWQNANVVEAPTLRFDRDQRSLLAEGVAERSAEGPDGASRTQAVSTSLVQAEKGGKVTPVTITSRHLTYKDADRKILLEGGVTARGADATLTAQTMTVYLLARSQSGNAAGRATAGQIEKIVAAGAVTVTQAARHAQGEQLVYTAAEDKFVLTGGSPSIFDAERGKITGDSLTFYRHDDRVLVEGREASPAVTKTQVAR